MARISPARDRMAALLIISAATLLLSCGGEDTATGPPAPGSEIRVMAVAASYVDDGQPLVDVTVVVSRDGAPVMDAAVTLNGTAIPQATLGGASYRLSALPFADGRAVAIDVVSSSGSRAHTGTLPGAITLREPRRGESIPDDASIPIAWDPVSWDSTATPREITLEYTQGNPFYFVTLPPQDTDHEISALVTSPTAMEFLVVEAWSGHADPGNLTRGDWLGQDGLRLGSRGVTWVEITD